MNFNYNMSQYYADDWNELASYILLFAVLTVICFVFYPILRFKARKTKTALASYSYGDDVETFKKKFEVSYGQKNKFDKIASIFGTLSVIFLAAMALTWLIGGATLSVKNTNAPFREDAVKVINTTYDVNVTEVEVRELFDKNFNYEAPPEREYVSYGVVETLTDDDVVVSMKLVWVRDEFRLVYSGVGSELVEVNKR